MMVQYEPMPDFASHDPAKLESTLKNIQQTFGDEELYPNLTSKAAALFYFMIKNHAFENGNKRMAVSTLLFFLLKNNKWIHIDPRKLYELAVSVAKSKTSDKNKVLEIIQKLLRDSISDVPKELGKFPE